MVGSDNSPVPRYPDLLRLDGKGFVVVGTVDARFPYSSLSDPDD